VTASIIVLNRLVWQRGYWIAEHMNRLTATPAPSDVAEGRTRAWRHSNLIADGFPLADLSEHLNADPSMVAVVDVFEPDYGEFLALTYFRLRDWL
jgi:hypothetical protein